MSFPSKNLVEHWERQNIRISTADNQIMKRFDKSKNVHLPYDFIELYSRVNGMEDLYPNYTDEEGFLFYPLNKVLTLEEEFGFRNNENDNTVFIFADYLQKSWWYGFKINSQYNYVIGLVASYEIFRPITDSLFEFIQLYIDDSPKLYY